MADDGAVSSICRLSRPSLVLHSWAVAKVHRLAECIKFFLFCAYKAFFLENADSPIQVFYSSDSTPASTAKMYKGTWGEHVVKRRGRTSFDFLVHRLLVINGKGEVRVCLDEPRTISDKTAWTHVQAFRQLTELPRS